MTYAGVKGIIFDLGSTLIEYENRSWTDIAYDGQKLGYAELTDSDHSLPDFETFNSRLEEIKEEFRQPARESLMEWKASEAPEKLFMELGLEDPINQSRRFMKTFYAFVREQITLEPNALETLRRIKDMGFETGLISNTIFAAEDHDADVEMYGLTPYLGFRIYSSEFGKRKPHVDIFREGLNRIGLAAGEVVYIGDRFMEDVEGPLAAGIRPVLKFVERRSYPDPFPEGIPVIRNLSELTRVVHK